LGAVVYPDERPGTESRHQIVAFPGVQLHLTTE
jgi:hypothetical protein